MTETEKRANYAKSIVEMIPRCRKNRELLRDYLDYITYLDALAGKSEDQDTLPLYEADRSPSDPNVS